MKPVKVLVVVFAPVAVLAASALWILTSMSRPSDAPLVAHVRIGGIRQSVRGVGTLESQDLVALHAGLEGRLHRMLLSPGDRIKKGDTMYEIRNASFRREFDLARAELEQARGDLERLTAGPDPTAVLEAKSNVRKTQEAVRTLEEEYEQKRLLFDKGFVSRKELEDLEVRLQQARLEKDISLQRFESASRPASPEEIDLKRAQISKESGDLKKMRKQWRSRRLKAQFDALVVETAKQEGDLISEGDLILTIMDTAKPYVVHAMVYESEVSKLKAGQAATVSISEVARPLRARVEEVSMVAKQSGTQRKFPVKLALEETWEGPVRLGIAVTYEVVIVERRSVPVLPVQFVTSSGGKTGVWALRAGALEFIPIRLGLSDESFIEIVSGLAAGQEVVLPASRERQ